jgi:hypothetical protein
MVLRNLRSLFKCFIKLSSGNLGFTPSCTTLTLFIVPLTDFVCQIVQDLPLLPNYSSLADSSYLFEFSSPDLPLQ